MSTLFANQESLMNDLLGDDMIFAVEERRMKTFEKKCTRYITRTQRMGEIGEENYTLYF